jgi:hypothetical protein
VAKALSPVPPRQTVHSVCFPSVKLRPRIRLSDHLLPKIRCKPIRGDVVDYVE